jgi:hypothetical protein
MTSQQQQPQPSAMPSFLQWYPNKFLDKLICACGSLESQVLDETDDFSVGSVYAEKKQAAYYDMKAFADDADQQSSIHRKETLPIQNTSTSTSCSMFQSRPIIEGTLSFMDLEDSIREQAPQRMGSQSIFSRGDDDTRDSSSSVDCFKYDLSENSGPPAIRAADTYTTVSMSMSYQEEDKRSVASTEAINNCFRKSNLTTAPPRSSVKQQHTKKIDAHEAYGYLLRMKPKNYLQDDDDSECMGVSYRRQSFYFEDESSESLPPSMPIVGQNAQAARAA